MNYQTTSRFLVPVHNPGDTLKSLLCHISNLPDIELSDMVIIDDGSTDGTSELLKRQFPEVKRIAGNGSLFWTGSMVAGMKSALDDQVDFIFWLNHDCQPVSGSADLLRKALKDPAVGCAGAWCRIKGYPEWPVNPGVYKNKEIGPLSAGEIRKVHGVNGNFVGFKADAIRKVGFPSPRKFPHYGDGPYTLQMGRSGYHVVVVASARANLEYEILRRLTPFWRVALSEFPVYYWLNYFLFNIKSRFHFKTAYFESRVYRPGLIGPIAYLKKMGFLIGEVIIGTVFKRIYDRAQIIAKCINTYAKEYPIKKLKLEIRAKSGE
ncbi:MAG: glycosyltransferase family 2 protein [Verrucomicrobiota bacterium]